jgi:hypothetical protein
MKRIIYTTLTAIAATSSLHAISLTSSMREGALNEIYSLGQEIPYDDVQESWSLLDAPWTDLTLEAKRNWIQALPNDVKEAVIIDIGNRLLNAKLKNPFTLPAHFPILSHFDAALLMFLEFIDNTQATIYQTLHNTIGMKDILKIKSTLDKPELHNFLPSPLQNKMFNQSLAQQQSLILLIKKRVVPGLQQ